MDRTSIRLQHRTADRAAVPQSFVGLLLVLAALLTLNTALGPLGVDALGYELSATIENQLIGLELVTVLLVVPACLWSAALSNRGRPAGPLLAIGPSSYTAYMFVQYVVGPEYDRYSATVLLHLALMTVSGAVAFWAWSLSRLVPPPATGTRSNRRQAALLLGFAGFVLLRYVGLFTGAVTGGPIEPEYAADRSFFWSIVLLDLGVVVPVTVVAAVAVLRGSATGRRAVYAVVAWFALVPPSVAAMGLVMLVRGDPNASAGTVVLLGTASVLLAAVAAAVFRPLLRSG